MSDKSILRNDNPKVSIIIPTYNRADFIGFTLDHILLQSYDNWECLVIDDGSNDPTFELLQTFQQRDNRIKFFTRHSKHLKGPSGCRNQGLDLASGDFIVFIDSDDIPHPEELAICLEQLAGRKDLKFCRFNKQPFKDKWIPLEFDFSRNFSSELVDINKLDAIIKNELAFACCTVMWRREAIGNQRFNEDLIYAEEWEYYIRLLSGGLKGVSINKILYYNRKHASSNTGQFWSYHQEMRRSNFVAINSVVDLLNKQQLLNRELIHYFLRLGFFLDNLRIIERILELSGYGRLKKLSYKIGYRFYPILRPVFKLKSQFSG